MDVWYKQNMMVVRRPFQSSKREVRSVFLRRLVDSFRPTSYMQSIPSLQSVHCTQFFEQHSWYRDRCFLLKNCGKGQPFPVALKPSKNYIFFSFVVEYFPFLLPKYLKVVFDHFVLAQAPVRSNLNPLLYFKEL